MDDDDIIRRIGALVEEEHSLERTLAANGPDEAAAERLREVEVALDQCWDLLRQRDAAREFGSDPDAATVRDPGTVENYLE